MQELNPGERWAPLPGYANRFEVSDHGGVRSVDCIIVYKDGHRVRYRGRMLKQELERKGYLWVRLNFNGGSKSKFVHSLVLETFVGPCPEGMECCHGNGNPRDNRLLNLRWGTHAENVRDTIRHGNFHKLNLTHCPRGHLLEEPNIVPNKVPRGYRACWACSKAADYGRYCKAYSRPFDFQTEADEYYRRIMAGDTGNRHKACSRGHLLQPPNIPAALAAQGKIACLACRRTGNNRADAKKAGRPFDFQAVSDMHYERIMAGIQGALNGASRLT